MDSWVGGSIIRAIQERKEMPYTEWETLVEVEKKRFFQV